ncbi:hypothetical protein [Aeoliella mucimassa]|uniref:Porin family protein n=1 Tax=Aeoliella mucimassa TaxID=2527972 RepID=A0A518ALF8_9BACT|nr:hypothetical protein [Aeoliella mucimassa]QDU55565.1 hypothetical protein Pan181_17570 [Aeoliella mucimassa]
MQTRALKWIGMCLVTAGAGSLCAQTAQIPSTNYGAFPQQTPTYAAPSTSTFATPNYGGTTYGSAPIAPPTFDSYATPTVSGTTGAPSVSMPYGYSAPPASGTYTFPQQTAPVTGNMQNYPYAASGYQASPQQGIYPDGLPYQWQQGTYGYEASDGSLVKFQKFLQRIGLEHTWIAGNGGDQDFELNRTEIAATFGIPVMHNIETPLLLTPGFAINMLEGPIGDPLGVPRGPDLPGQMYDAYVDLSWYPRPSEWFAAELGVRTGVWTDFDTMNSDSVRILGRGLGVISVTPQMDILIGVVYLDRMSVKILPAGGVHWRPNQDWDLYLVFPNPKLRRRLQSTGNTDWWWYVAGEYGGGSWTVDRVGLPDRIDYNDIRFSLGLEWETPKMARGHMEVGYVFDREILFASGDPAKFTPNDSVMLRAGFDF